jgi:hypothetical protein
MIVAGYALLVGKAWEAQSQDGLLCKVLHCSGETEKNPQNQNTRWYEQFSQKKSDVPLP